MRGLITPGKDGKAARIPSTFLKQSYKDLVASVQGTESLGMAESRAFVKAGAKGRTFLTAVQLGKAVSIAAAEVAIYTSSLQKTLLLLDSHCIGCGSIK